MNKAATFCIDVRRVTRTICRSRNTCRQSVSRSSGEWEFAEYIPRDGPPGDRASVLRSEGASSQVGRRTIETDVHVGADIFH